MFNNSLNVSSVKMVKQKMLIFLSYHMYYKDAFPVKKFGDDDGSGNDAFPFIQGVSHSQLPHPNQLLQARFFMSIFIFMNI